MTANFGVKISGDSKGGVSAISLTGKEIKKLKNDVDAYSSGSKVADANNKRLTSSVDGAGASFKRMLAPVASVFSVMAGLKKILEVSREFDVLNAQLITATGSSENAKIAFDAIQDFAQRTPYDLQQVTKGFTQLVNLGLTPSERALTSYGDTASAMGKDLGQLVEAVADATTGEFERLKEFGIKAKSEGDNVSFTFRGVSTTVKKNAEEIEGYLINLGENNFAGAMANRMATLDGAISNLGDSWDKLFLTVSQQGTSNMMSDVVRETTAAIEELTAMIASGQLGASIDAVGGKFSGFANDAIYSVDLVSQLLDDAYSQWGDGASDLGADLTGAFTQLPENVRASIKIMTVEILSSFDNLGIGALELKEKIAAIFTGDTIEAATQRRIDREIDLERLRSRSIADILKERDVAVRSYDDQADAAISLRDKYNEMLAARAEQNKGVDVLGSLGIGGGGDQDQSSTQDAASAAKFEALRLTLIGEEEAIAASYEKRREMIINNTLEDSEQQLALLNALNEQKQLAIYDHEAKLGSIEAEAAADRIRNSKKAGDLQVKNELGRLAAMTAGTAQSSREMFEINKALSVASILVSTPRAIAGAYAAGAEIGGPYLGAAYAALAGIAQFSQLRAATSATFTGNGTGTTPSAAGTTPIINSTPIEPAVTSASRPAEATQQINIYIDNLSGNDVELMAEQLKSHIADSDFVLIETSSRNGQELAA